MYLWLHRTRAWCSPYLSKNKFGLDWKNENFRHRKRLLQVKKPRLRRNKSANLTNNKVVMYQKMWANFRTISNRKLIVLVGNKHTIPRGMYSKIHTCGTREMRINNFLGVGIQIYEHTQYEFSGGYSISLGSYGWQWSNNGRGSLMPGWLAIALSIRKKVLAHFANRRTAISSRQRAIIDDIDLEIRL